jgi:hypothetical protein
MPWFKVDDNLAFHYKTVAAGVSAMGLWVRAGSWCAQTLTDGFVPEHMVPALADGDAGLAGRLVEAGLWRRVKGGFVFHEWTDRQPSRQSIENLRTARAAAGRNGGLKSGQVRGTKASKPEASGEASASSKPEASASLLLEPPTRPDPTHPKKPRSKPTSPRAARGADRFDEFYDAYPRHVDRRDAEKAWSNVIKRDSPDEVIAAAKRYALSQRGKEKKYMKYPATWLNKGCYFDEPEQPDLRLVSGDPSGIHRDPTTGRVVEW